MELVVKKPDCFIDANFKARVLSSHSATLPNPASMTKEMASLLPLVDACDNCRVETSDERLLPLLLQAPSSYNGKQFPLGFLRPQIVDLLKEDSSGSWIFSDSDVSFSKSLDTASKRSSAVERVVRSWVKRGLFTGVTGGRLWRDELYAVYTKPFGPFIEENLAFTVERSAAQLFGTFTYGVDLTIWVRAPNDQCMVWVPTRSKSKQTWPEYLDNSVAGGIPWGLSPTESIVKEAQEEASLNEATIRSRIKAAGCTSYLYRSKLGWLQPEVQFGFDLELRDANEMVPKPFDGEVQSFELCSVTDCIEKMRQGRFKPNGALVLIEFLIRHGYVTPENESHYFEIVTRLKGRAGFEQIY